jgi:hypothetical protein
MPLDESVIQAVSNTNFKVKGEIGTDQIIQLREESMAHWAAGNKIREGYLLRGLRDFAEENISEAMAQQQVRTGNSVAETNSAVGLSAALVASLAQIVAKLGQSTPPETGAK